MIVPMSAFTTARSSGTTIFPPSTFTSMFLTPAAPDDVLSTQPHKAREIATTTQAECLSFILLSPLRDRKSTRLNSSHANISYAVFCLKKKKQTTALLLHQLS